MRQYHRSVSDYYAAMEEICFALYKLVNYITKCISINYFISGYQMEQCSYSWFEIKQLYTDRIGVRFRHKALSCVSIVMDIHNVPFSTKDHSIDLVIYFTVTESLG